MQHINELTKNPLRSDQSTKQKKPLPSLKLINLVTLLWQRMNELFPYQWDRKAGEILTDDKNGYNDNFLVWCDKTKLLSTEEWKRGVERIEQDIVKNTAKGEKNYPPSYAEFIGLCKPTISPDGTNSAAYIQYQPEKLIEDQGHVSKRKKAGRKALDEMMKDL